ncbi:uncharacterized protein LOC131022767 [Salvia miltiorrhiza]|uniref:uncharacterized protein LOC131022767 n=1 Tax=Salvia miltiorrhiza TaxID=226208 RepID=UPI0025AD4CFA|nr:uncharacterized protein LOC131022767 [Salvia miltiorrhiza]XP_057808272.1 uncharacterized protein LOC131022767 [Salvia miltiorrhiza]
MHRGFYRTTLAAARLFNESSALRLGKIMNKSVRSMAGGNSATSHIKISEQERGQPQPINSSTYEKDYPPLSVNFVKSKRGTRLPVVNCSKQKPEVAQNIMPLQHEASNIVTCSGEKLVQNVEPLQREAANLITCSKQNLEKEVHNISTQCEASTSMSDHIDSGLPTSFGKKQLSSSRKPKVRQTRVHEHQEAKRRPKPSSKPSSYSAIEDPFDICLPKSSDSPNYVNKRYTRVCSPMRQPAEENEQSKGITEKGNDTEDLVEESGLVLGPGMVLLKHYIPLLEQVNIVNKCQELGCGPGGFYRPGYNDGAKLRLFMMCLGLDWDPQTASYGERRRHDNTAPPDLPREFTSLVCRALDDSHSLIERTLKVENVDDVLPKMSPDLCIVNFYTSNGRLGLHQDRDETQESLYKRLPVVSISIGDSAEFLYGRQRDANKANFVTLESGDVLIFGGGSRHIYHGVNAIIPDTAPLALLESTRLRPGRLNLTFRKY